MSITLGYTRSDRYGDTVLPGGYVPSCDGYKAGAAQDEITFDIDWAMTVGDQALDWAEAAFVATNAPWDVIERDRRALVIRHELALRTDDWRALSVGDTVAVLGERYACERVGWQRVEGAAVS